MAGPRLTTMAPRVRRLPARLRRLPVSIGYFRGPKLMSWLRKRWVRFRNPHADIRFGRGTYLGPGFSLDMPFGGTFVTGEYVEFRRNFRAEFGARETRIEFGARSSCTYDVVLQCTTSITVGERCGFAHGTTIVDGSHRFRDIDRTVNDQGNELRPIHIDDDAMISASCTIIADVGRRAFVGANAVVTRPVPPYTVAVGVPARPIDHFGPPEARRAPES
jgi:acetyltransferase-like isoleucine patch superfamily enzyme